MRVILLPLALLLATCAPVAEPPPVAVASPAEVRASDAAAVVARLPCQPADQAEARLVEAGYRLVAAGVAPGVVARLWLGGTDAFALVAHPGDGRACLIANGRGWTRLRSASSDGQAGLPAEALAKAGLQALVPFTEAWPFEATLAEAAP